ncbi:MAG: response regulator [Phycisphaerales bacterium]|nr:response regulator [Hyphomonadaceae bacterium]
MLAAGEQRRTVLVVEDEVLVRLALADDLRARGYTVIEAASGDEARKLVLAGVEFDLIVSDITMPGELDGADLARWLHDNHVTTPVMLTSGMPSALDAARESCANVTAFVSKPYDHDDLLQQVEALLARSDD